MKNLSKFSIVVSFFALWITTNFSFTYQIIFGFAVIFLFGILHGANDILLIKKIYNNNKVSNTKLLMYYIGVVLTGALLFYFIPTIALLLFIIISAYHFGEQHWNTSISDITSKWVLIFYTLYGLFILFLLFSFHTNEVNKIVFQICNKYISFLNIPLITISIGTALIVTGFFINKISKKFKSQIVVNLFYLIVFAIIFKTADLIWAFAIYFVIWHSLPSIIEQIKFLYGDLTQNNIVQYFKSALLYWLISLAGIFVLYFFLKDKEFFNALFFSFIAAITFPHTIVMIYLEDKK